MRKKAGLKRAAELLALACLLLVGSFFGVKRYESFHAEPDAPIAASVPEASAAPDPAPAPTPEPTSAPCPHPRFENGLCADCGYVCPHAWEGGVCRLCGLVCPHERHEADSLRCARCGERVPHRFEDYRCARCDTAVELSLEEIPERYFTPCPERGRVESLDLRSFLPDDVGGGRAVPALVYLPYGYDESDGPCNVIVTLHGAGSDEHGMMDELYAIGGKAFCYRDIYDWMICEGKAQPFVLLSFSTHALTAESLWTASAADELSRALREGILPGLVSRYRSFAASPDPDAIAAARAHFGVVGVSDGSLYALWAALGDNLPLFGSYTCLSANFPETTKKVLERLNAPDAADWPIACFYTGAGRKDFQQENTEKRFYELVDGCGVLREGVNAFHVDVTGYHNWITWGLELCHCLQLMFQDYPADAVGVGT